jgi:hypothetical protein
MIWKLYKKTNGNSNYPLIADIVKRNSEIGQQPLFVFDVRVSSREILHKLDESVLVREVRHDWDVDDDRQLVIHRHEFLLHLIELNGVG